MATFVSPAAGRISGEWGARIHPITKARGHHRGIDIANSVGTPIYAAYGGTVRATRSNSWRGDKTPNPITGTWNTGNFILIDGPGGGSEYYGHLATIAVKPGQKVVAGQKIGTMGQTGNVTGPHLHFETWSGRSGSTNHNPRVDFNKYGVAPGSAPKVTAAAPKPAAKPATVPDTDLVRAQKALAALGYYKGAIDNVAGAVWKAAVNRYINAQKYRPGLKADGVWGPACWAHFEWTKTLQRALNKWKGDDIPVDGRLEGGTVARIRDVQQRNKGGTYKGAVDGVPGPVFCKMLGIPKHPGA